MKTKLLSSGAQRDFSSKLVASNRALLSNTMDVQNQNPILVGFVLLENFSMAAFTTAVDALVTANLLVPAPFYKIETISLQSSTVTSDLGIDISASTRIDEIELPVFDMIFVCGGYRTVLQQLPDLNVFLQSSSKKNCSLGGLWNGSFFLQQAGLLQGFEYTIHPENRDLMEEISPGITISSSPYVIDRDRISCAGASSALDMMFEVIERHYGDDLVRGIKDILICDKTGESPDEPMLGVSLDPTLPEPLLEILRLMENNIDEPLSMADIADCIGLSKRQIERLFVRYMDATPSKYYLELRIIRARRLLLQSNKSVADVAVACGFVSIPHFSHCFKDYFGCSPLKARRIS